MLHNAMSVGVINIYCTTHLYFSDHYKLIFTFPFFTNKIIECIIHGKSVFLSELNLHSSEIALSAP